MRIDLRQTRIRSSRAIVLSMLILLALSACRPFAGEGDSVISLEDWEYVQVERETDAAEPDYAELAPPGLAQPWQPTDRPNHISSDRDLPVLWLRHRMPEDRFATPAIYFRYATWNAQVYLDERFVYDHRGEMLRHAGARLNLNIPDHIVFGNNQMVLAPLPAEQNARYLYLRFESVTARIGPASIPVLGERFELYRTNVRESLDNLAVGAVLLYCAIIGLFLYAFNVRRLEFLGFALYGICFGLYILSRSSLFELIYPDYHLWSRMELIALYFGPTGYALFIYNTVRRDWVHALIFVYFVAFTAVAAVGYLIGYSLFALLFVFQLSALVAIVASLTSCGIAAFRGGREALIYFVGLCLAFFANGHDIVLSMTGAAIWSSPISHYGALILLTALGTILGLQFASSRRSLRRLSEELARRNEDLTRLDQLKDEFLSNTSHELRTPLNGIIGIADSLVEGAAGPVNDKMHQNLALIVASGRRLASLVNDILDFQKLRNREIHLKLEPIDLRALTEVVLAVSRPLLGPKQLELKNEVPHDLPALNADESRLYQILHNLVGNAIKFTESGYVSVSAQRLDESTAEILVRDTGAGIPSEKHESIFESFEQGDASIEREHGGTGLGLPITRRLIELHGGQIRVESEQGRGATFRFTLPTTELKAPVATTSSRQGLDRVEEVQTFARASPPEEGDAPAGTFVRSGAPADADGRIALVVDDETVNRQTLVNLLSMRNFQVVEATDGENALQLMESMEPTVVLLDVMMPRMSGYEVCRKLREHYALAELPIIMLTARNRVDDLVTGFESGASDYLTKPFSRVELLARVGMHANLKMAHAEALRLRAKLTAQDKMAAIGSMAAGIVHDVRNPISVITGYAEMADDDNLGRDNRSSYLHIISEEAERIASMLQDILEFSRGSVQVTKETVEIGPYLERVGRTLEEMVRERDIQLTIESPPREYASLDPARFLRVLVNIADNAIDAMGSGGKLIVQCSVDGGNVVFSVTDSGPGIPREIRDTLFEPFVTSGKAEGTGLGMAITQNIVQAHGGEISFVTGENGTTFRIVLPGS